jgi:hypothetical protein
MTEEDTVLLMKDLIVEILQEQFKQSGLTEYEYQQHPDSVGMTKEELYNEVIKRMPKMTSEGYKQYIEDKPPYRIIKEKNENNNKFHWNLWTVDNMRNLIEIVAIKDKKKDLDEDIKILFIK